MDFYDDQPLWDRVSFSLVIWEMSELYCKYHQRRGNFNQTMDKVSDKFCQA